MKHTLSKICTLLCLLVLFFSGGPPLQLPDNPNIILILADDLGYETIACNGGTSYRAPNLDQLAATGMRFTHCYATPLCTPSQVQLMTGKYNFRNYEKFGYLNPKEKTFANLLQDAGYKTAIAGKWQLGGNAATVKNFGFDEFCMWQLSAGDFLYRYKDPKITVSTGYRQYGPDIFTDFILHFMERHRNERFFVYYPMCLVHDPFQPTPATEAFGSYMVQGTDDTTYFRPMVAYMDKLEGKITTGLERLNLPDNTVIIFTGDNGTSPKVFSRMGNHIVQGDKGNTTEAGTHVPLIVNWPGHTLRGTVLKDLIDFTDFLPAMAGVAGVPLTAAGTFDGQSFYGQLTGKKTTPRKWIFCDYDPKGRDFTPQRYAQDHRWKLYASGKFYDLQNDRLEKHPLPQSKLTRDGQRAYRKLQTVLEKYDNQLN